MFAKAWSYSFVCEQVVYIVEKGHSRACAGYLKAFDKVCFRVYTVWASCIFLHNTHHACEGGCGNAACIHVHTYVHCLCLINLSRLVLFLQMFIQWLSDMYPAYRLYYVTITFIVGEAAGSLLSKRSQSTTRAIAPSWLPSRWGQSVCTDTLVDFMCSLDLVLRR